MAWARCLYSVVTWAAQPLLRRKLARRARAEPGYAHAVPERFGYYAAPLVPGLQAPGPCVWVHAVSLGETRAAAILVQALRQQLPGMRLLLTHGTATGRAEGARLLRAGDVQVWQPWDTPAAVRRFLRTFRPHIGVLMETEVWPNLVAGCQQEGVPLVLANARLNALSLRKAERVGALARPAYAGLSAVWAQTEADAERLRALGAPVRGVWGNLKFDARPDRAQQAQGQAWRAASPRPVVLLASSREGEEALWVQALQRLRQTSQGPEKVPKNTPKVPPDQSGKAQDAINIVANDASSRGMRAAHALAPDEVQWLIVPRHPQRFDEVEQLLRAAGLQVSRRSQWPDGPAPAAVWLGDSLGEMAAYYSLADVVLLGGSFAPLGGQNLIEAAACGCPLVLGPHTFNFSEAAEQACEEGLALRVPDLDAALATACALLADGPRHASMRSSALQFVTRHQGAAQATAAAVAAWVTAPQVVR